VRLKKVRRNLHTVGKRSRLGRGKDHTAASSSPFVDITFKMSSNNRDLGRAWPRRAGGTARPRQRSDRVNLSLMR
jgi:hypothetical protein